MSFLKVFKAKHPQGRQLAQSFSVVLSLTLSIESSPSTSSSLLLQSARMTGSRLAGLFDTVVSRQWMNLIERLRQEDHESQARRGFTDRPLSKQNKDKETTQSSDQQTAQEGEAFLSFQGFLWAAQAIRH